MTSTLEPAPRALPAGWRGLITRHRPIVVLLPISLAFAWTIALVHGPVAVPPPNQGLLAEVLSSIAESPVLRLVWWLWIAGTLVLIEAIARRYGVGDLVVIAVGAVLVVSPTGFWIAGWAGTDGPLVFVGALAIWLAGRYADGRDSGWWLILCAFAAGAFGITALLAFLVVLLQLIGVAVVRGSDRLRLTGVGALAMIAALVLPLVGALLGLSPATGSAPAVGDGTIGVIGWFRIVLNAMVETGLGTLSEGGIGLPGAPEYFYAALGWVVIAGVVVAFFQARRSRLEAPLVVATAATVLLAGPLLLLVAFAMQGEWVVLPQAGIAVLLPVFLVVAATTIRNRAAAWLVIGWSAVVGVLDVVLAIVATG